MTYAGTARASRRRSRSTFDIDGERLDCRRPVTISYPPCSSHALIRHVQGAIIAVMAGVGPVPTTCWTEVAQPPRERRVGELAARQHGVVALTQLSALGLSESAVRSRVAAGRLHRLHRGVYAVGHPVLTSDGRWLAAVLACGSGAVLSHRSAADLWGLRPSARTAIDVTAHGRAGRGRPEIDAHRADTLDPADTTAVRGIPCTSVARTLLDLAEVLDRRGLARAFDQAEVLRILDLGVIRDVLERAGGRRGAPLLGAVLAEHRAGEALTRSELEQRFLGLCAAAGIPRPHVNAWVLLDDGGALDVDFMWAGPRLIAETDGYRTHGTRGGFERDRERDRRLLVAGWRVARFTWRQLIDDPVEVAGALRALLARPEPPPGHA